MTEHRNPVRRTVASVLATALLVVAAGCTGDPDSAGEPGPSALPSRSVGSGATLEAKPVPMEIKVAKVIGPALEPSSRKQLKEEVARTISSYFDAAFLAGRYPREKFPGAFAKFSSGAARRAEPDRDLLTNVRIGADTEAVVPRTKRALLYVLRHDRGVPGLTARIRLVFIQERLSGTDQRVTVKGRLLMNRDKAGRWQVFGYDLTRSNVPAGKRAS